MNGVSVLAKVFSKGSLKCVIPFKPTPKHSHTSNEPLETQKILTV